MISKNNTIISIVLALLIAFPLGYVLGGANAEDNDKTETAQHDDLSHMTGHAHEMYEVPAGVAAPGISLILVNEDKKAGWNLVFQTENFTFAPENASGDHVDGEGHAHLYIDGKKITRLYSDNYYLGELSEGSHDIKVTLNTNDHRDYSVNGAVVAASQTVTDDHHADDETEADDHSH